MKKTFVGIFTLLTLIISCKKSDSGTDVPTPAASYMSLTPGSTWDYQITNNLTSAITLNKVISTSRDSGIGRKQYHVFTNSNGSGNSYYNITANEYWTFAGLGVTTSGVENNYLNSGVAAGTSWSQTVTLPVNGTPVQVTLTNTVTAKAISKTVNAVAYTDVIHITTAIAVAGIPANLLITDIQSFYAPKVGLIESKNKINFSTGGVNIDQNTILKTSVIN
jgi:hypothetical protein